MTTMLLAKEGKFGAAISWGEPTLMTAEERAAMTSFALELIQMSPEERAAYWSSMDEAGRHHLLKGMRLSERTALLEAMSPDEREAFLASLSYEERVLMLAAMDPEARVAYITSLSPQERLALVAAMSPEERSAFPNPKPKPNPNPNPNPNRRREAPSQGASRIRPGRLCSRICPCMKK